MSQSFLDSSFLKSGISIITKFVNALDWLIDKAGALPTILGTIAASMSIFKNQGFFKVAKDELTGLVTGIETGFGRVSKSIKNALSEINVDGGFAQKLFTQSDIDALNNYNNALQTTGDKTAAWNTCMANASSVAQEVARSNEFMTDGLNGYIKAQQAAQVSTIAQNKSLSSAKVLMQEYYSGCKTTGMAQEDFLEAINKTNPELATAIRSSDNAKSAMVSYGTSLVGAKIKTIALQAATTLLNAAITMGISFLISTAISAISKWINKEEELAEEVEELTSKFKEQHEELQKLKSDYDTSNESSMVSKYAKLSKGVDALGKNVALTADEYSEYQSIVETIADQIPSLVSGYDSQGNAILSCKGNVEELTRAYEELIHIQNQKILTNSDKIEEDFANTLEKQSGTGWWSNNHGFFAAFDLFQLGDYEMKTSTADALKEILEDVNETTRKEKIDFLRNSSAGLTDRWTEAEIRTALKDAGVDIHWYDDVYDVLEEQLKTDPSKIKGILDNYYSQFSENVEKVKTIALAKLKEAFDVSGDVSGLNYGNISETLQNIARQTVNGLDYDFFSELSASGKTVEQWVTEILNQLNRLSEDDSSQIEAAFDLQTQFNGGKISYGEYVDGIRNVKKLINQLDLDDELENQLKLTLNADEVTETYKTLKTRLTSEEFGIKMTTDEAEEFLDGLTASKYAVAVDLIVNGEVDLSDFDIDSLEEYIEKEAKIQEALNFETDIEIDTTALETLNEALEESASACGLSAESIDSLKKKYADLDGYDPSTLFESTANGVKVNRNELEKLEKEYDDLTKTEVKEHIDTLTKAYNENAIKIDECTDATKRAQLIAKNETYKSQIEALATYQAQLEGVTGAYQKWIDAQSGPEDYEGYESVATSYEDIKDEIGRGFISNKSKAYIDLLSGEDLDGGTIDDYANAWEKLDDKITGAGYSIIDFFTVNDDGDITAQGIDRFFKSLQTDFKGSIAKLNEESGKWEYDFSRKNLEKIQKEYGIGIEAIELLLEGAIAAGYNVDWDGILDDINLDTSSYESVVAYAKAANSSINELAQSNKALKESGFGDYEFNFEASTIEDVNAELEKAKELLNNDAFKDEKTGKFNIDAEGAKEALVIAQTLQSFKNQLEEPAYMSIDTTELQEGLQEPVKLLQQYEELRQEREILNLSGTDKERLQEIENELNSIAEDLVGLKNDDVKVQLGIDGLDIDEIREKLESGTIDVPAQLTIEANIDESLEDLLTLGLLEQGFITEEEAKVRLGLEVEVEVDGDIDEQIEDALDDRGYFGDSDGFGKKAARRTNIEIIANTVGIEDVDDLTSKLKGINDEQIKVIANVLGQVDVDKLQDSMSQLDSKSVQAIAEALGKGDVDGLKTAILNIPDKTVAQAIAEAFGYDDVNTLCDAIGRLEPKTVEAIANALGITDVNSLQAAISQLQSKTVVTTGKVSGKSKISSFKSLWNSIKSKTVTLFSKVIGGGSVRQFANGTANANGTAFSEGTTDNKTKNKRKSGTAFKQGNWGIEGSGTALVGELGPETLVRGGRFYTIGDTGAQFIQYRPNDIIFNHKQTEELFKYGKVLSDGGRGKVLVNGTAYANGSYPSNGKAFDWGANVTESTFASFRNAKVDISVDYDYSSSDDDSDKVQEIFDWIEVAIERIEREIDRLDTKANSVYRSWSERNSNLVDEISAVGDEIVIQEKAIAGYQQALNEIGLSQEYIDKIKSGAIDIDNITDETLAEKISDYQEYYEKILDCKDAILELKEKESELYKQRFDNVATQYEGMLSIIEHEKNMLDEYIAQSEAQGWLISEKYYDALISNEKSTISKLQQEKSALLSELQTAMESGTIDRYSESWYEMVAAIDEVTLSIEQSNTAILTYQQSIQQLKWTQFDLLQDKISAVTEEADFLIELLSSDKLYDDSGKLTDEGSATMGLHGQNYNSYMYQADLVAKEIEKVKKQLENDPYDTELEEHYRELISLQQEYILSAEDCKNSIKDLVSEGIELELSALEDLIDKYTDALDSQKD